MTELKNFYVLTRPNGANLVRVMRGTDGLEQRNAVTSVRVHNGDRVHVSIIEGMPVFEVHTYEPLAVAGPDAQADVDAVKCIIANLSQDSQRRVHTVAQILRELLAADDKTEVELAFTLIMGELAAR